MEKIDINNTPALAPPQGVESNLVNPYTLQPYLVATSSVCLSLSVLAVIARVFTKAWILKKMQMEDYSLIFAALGFAAFTGVMLAAGEAGQGKHQWNVSVAGLQKVALLANILEIVYPPTMFAAKLTVLVQIKKIFALHQKNFIHWAVQVLIASNFITYLATFIAFIFACWPREKIWNPHIPGKCISTHAAIIVTSAINVISDFTILFLPFFGIAALHLPLKKKFGVGAVFATGAFACISSVIRLVYSVRLAHTSDVTWAISPVGMWALAEFATVILVACSPTFPRLLKFLLGRQIDSKYAYSAERNQKAVVPHTTESAIPPYPWYDGVGTTMGSYIPLDERKDLSGGSRGATDRIGIHGQTSPSPGPPPEIYKRVEIEMVRH